MYQKSKSYLDDFECPRCGHCCQSEVHMNTEAMQMALEALESGNPDIQLRAAIALRQALETEPFEYWNAVEGWVKIDEVREHFDAVGCGTIYKSAGEGRSPLYTAPPHTVVCHKDHDRGYEDFQGKCLLCVVDELMLEMGNLMIQKQRAEKRNAALAQQEPVAWLSTDCIGERYLCFTKPKDNDPVQPLYTAPSKQWVGLTGKDIDDCYFAARTPDFDLWAFAAEIDDLLREKNKW